MQSPDPGPRQGEQMDGGHVPVVLALAEMRIWGEECSSGDPKTQWGFTRPWEGQVGGGRPRELSFLAVQTQKVRHTEAQGPAPATCSSQLGGWRRTWPLV